MLGDFLKLLAIELDPCLLSRVRDSERGLVALGQRLLAPLGLKEEVVKHFGIVERVGCAAGLGPEVLSKIHHDRLVPESTAQAVVAAGADDPDKPISDLDHRDVECPTPQVVNQNGLVLALLEAIGNRRGGRLVQDRPHAQAGQLAGVGCRLPFRRPKICGAGDDDIGDLLSQGDFRVTHHLAENERCHVLGAIGLPVMLENKIGIAHMLLDARHDPVWFHLGRFLGRIADDDVSAIEKDHRRSDPLALLVGDDHGLAVLVDIRDRRVSCSQVNPEDALETYRHGRGSRSRLGRRRNDTERQYLLSRNKAATRRDLRSSSQVIMSGHGGVLHPFAGRIRINPEMMSGGAGSGGRRVGRRTVSCEVLNHGLNLCGVNGPAVSCPPSR